MCINQIQLRFLHFNQHSITLLGIHMRHWAYKREKYTFINANIRVISIIFKIIRDNRQTFKCKRYSLTSLWHCLQFNSIPGQLDCWRYFLFCMPNDANECPKNVIECWLKCKNRYWIWFMRKCSLFRANKCFFALLVAASRKWMRIFW